MDQLLANGPLSLRQRRGAIADRWGSRPVCFCRIERETYKRSMTTKHLPQETPPRMFDETFLEVLTEKVAERLIPRLAQIAERTDGNETRYLSLEQAAEFIGTSYEGMRAMARKEHIPVVRRGARRHIDKRDLVAFMERNKAS